MLLKIWLNRRQIAHITKHRGEVPVDFKGKIDLKAHQKAADYTVEKTRLSTVSTIIASVLLILLTLGGLINVLTLQSQNWISHPLWSGVVMILCVFILSHLIELPVQLYQIKTLLAMGLVDNSCIPTNSKWVRGIDLSHRIDKIHKMAISAENDDDAEWVLKNLRAWGGS